MKNAAIFVAAGIAMMAGGFFWWTTSQPYSDGIITTGIVVQEIRSSDTYRAEIEFTTETGQSVTFVESTGSSSRNSIGDQVRVSYRPASPRQAKNLDASGTWVAYLFFAMGALFGFVGLKEVKNIKDGNPPTIRSSSSRSRTRMRNSGRADAHLTEDQLDVVTRAETSVVEVHGRIRSTVSLIRNAILAPLLGFAGLIAVLIGFSPDSGYLPSIIGLVLLYLSFRCGRSAIRSIRSLGSDWKSGAVREEFNDLADSMKDAASMTQETAMGQQQSPLADTPPPLPWKVRKPEPTYTAPADPTLGGTDPFDS